MAAGAAGAASETETGDVVAAGAVDAVVDAEGEVCADGAVAEGVDGVDAGASAGEDTGADVDGAASEGVDGVDAGASAGADTGADVDGAVTDGAGGAAVGATAGAETGLCAGGVVDGSAAAAEPSAGETAGGVGVFRAGAPVKRFNVEPAASAPAMEDRAAGAAVVDGDEVGSLAGCWTVGVDCGVDVAAVAAGSSRLSRGGSDAAWLA